MEILKRIKKRIGDRFNQDLEYAKDYFPLGISKVDYSDYVNKRINYKSDLAITSFIGKKIKRINSYSFIHSVEGIFIEQLYKFDADSTSPYIIDCGANIGLSVIYFKKLYPNCKIIAFEPDSKIYEACQYNLNQFGFQDVQLINAGIWNFDGNLNFLSDNSLGGRICEKIEEDKDVYSISVVNFKKYLNQPIDFLKIDIEGSELEILEDCQGYLGLVKNIFIEYHSHINKPQQLQKLVSILSQAGFRYYIKPAWDYLEHPYTDHKMNPSSLIFDLQLNIFGYRINDTEVKNP